jgi:Na+/proline symporter
MHLTLPITAFAFVFAGAITVSLFQKYFTKNKTANTPDGFLLASKNLDKLSIISLFLSTSFGMAAFFYAVWLGYSIGVWGFALQATWSIGFLFLIPYTKKIKLVNSLYDFLDKQFDSRTKLLSAICYLVSILFLMAWEVRIAQQPLATLISLSSTGSTIGTFSSANLAIMAILLIILFYTLLGGLKGNANVDKFLNLLKIISIVLIAFLLASNFTSFSHVSFYQVMFPSFNAIKEKIGIWGLTTNILLNLFSQFTDGSSWQNIIAGSRQQNSQWNLKISSLLIFLTVGFFGTVIGILLVGVPGITTDNILTAPFIVLHKYAPVIGFATLVLIIGCVMSLLNSALLVTTRIVSVDISPLWGLNNFKNKGIDEKQKLNRVKLVLVAIAIFSIGGINYILDLTSLNLFELIYIFVVCPFSYFGPVVIGLLSKRHSKKMWVSIIAALMVGLSSVFVGITTENKFLLDGAATFTLVTSLIIAYFISRRSK